MVKDFIENVRRYEGAGVADRAIMGIGFLGFAFILWRLVA
jgi:hypothetical protein